MTRARSPFSTRARDLLEQVVDLALGRADADLRIDDAGRADELLDVPLAALELVRPGCRAHVDGLVDGRLELLEGQRPVVEGGRQPEPEVDEDLLARPVVLVHPDDLRDRHVRLVDHEQPVRREVVEQRPWPRAGLAPGEMTRVVLDAGAVAELAHHLEVERRALAEPGALERAALGLEPGDTLLHLGLDVDDGFLELVLRRDVVGRRVDVGLLALGEQFAGQRVELGDPLDDVAEELDPDERLLGRRLELERVAADAEPGAAHRLVVALVLEVDQVAQDGVAPVLATDPQLEHGRAVVDRGTEAVDARHRGDDDHVAALEQGVRGGVAEPIDLVVARRVLLDVRVRPREVRLRLVIVEVADEVLDRVLGEELAELGVELGGQRLVVGEDEGRLVVVRYDVAQRVRLSATCDAEQDLVLETLGEALGQRFDRLGLVARRFERGDEFEVGHLPVSLPAAARTEQVFCVLSVRVRGRKPLRGSRLDECPGISAIA